MPDPKDKAPPPQDDKGDDSKVETLSLSQEELDAKIADAVKAAVKADRKAQKKAANQRQPPADDPDPDDDPEEDAAEIISKAEARAAKAEQEATAAKKEALLARVENKLNAHLALNFRDFMGNAPDIMLHIAAALTPDAKEGEIARLIDSHTKAFVERTKATRKPASGAPIGGARGRLAGLVGGTSDNEGDRTAARAAAASGNAAPRRAFSQVNWNG